MPSKTFLHPSQRSLKTEQIGPSGHKNQYHVGVLDGNWLEERKGFGPQPQKNTSFNTTSTNRISYSSEVDEATRRSAKPSEAVSFEAPRELLFYHGSKDHTESQFSIAELSYRGAKKDNALSYKEIIAMEGVSPRRSRSNAKKMEAAYGNPETANDDASSEAAAAPPSLSSEGNANKLASTTASTTSSAGYHLPPIGQAMTRDRFTTSKNVTIDAVGVYTKEHPEVFEHSSFTKSRGEFLTSLNSIMHKTHLRY